MAQMYVRSITRSTIYAPKDSILLTGIGYLEN